MKRIGVPGKRKLFGGEEEQHNESELCEAQETRGSKFICEFGRNSTVYCFVASGLLYSSIKDKKKVATSDMKLATTMAQRVGFEPTGDCSHDGFRVHAVMTSSVPLHI